MDNNSEYPDQAPLTPAAEICFGLDRSTDERSLALLLEAFADPELQALLVPRLEEEELADLADTLLNLLRTHLNHQEYHRFF